jgi:hypothetical protein
MTRITDAEKELLPIHCGALRRRGEEITADLIEHVLLAEINDLTSEVERLKAVAAVARRFYVPLRAHDMACTCDGCELSAKLDALKGPK